MYMHQDRFSSIHEHCMSCYNLYCTRPPDYSTCCEMIECQLECGNVFHACKQPFHLPLCPNNVISCTNREHGCNLEIRKSEMATHIKECPASVFICLAKDGKGKCGKTVRRDEFSWHSRNIHSDITEGLTVSCPLVGDGCNFACQKRTPLCPKGNFIYSDLLNSYGVRVDDTLTCKEFSLVDTEKTNFTLNQNLGCYDFDLVPNSLTDDQNKNNYFYLEDLPDNVLEHIILNLDGFSINNLSLTSKFLRQMCKSMLNRKGMVEAIWSRVGMKDTTWKLSSWKWSFSSCCFPVKQWQYHLSTSVNEHLKVCPFYSGRVTNKNATIECPNKCGLSFPELMKEEHKKYCQLEKTHCVNKLAGCPAVVIRSKMGSHLRTCPANVVKCPANNTKQEMINGCKEVFRKEEMRGHLQFTHVDVCEDTIIKCPLNTYGCTFEISKRMPSKPNGDVIFDVASNAFSILPNEQYPKADERGKHLDELPTTILQYILSLLDSLSLRNLARSNKFFRNICETLLPGKGMVDTVWKKCKSTTTWEATKLRRSFSKACSPVSQWKINLSNEISEHMKECPKYTDKNIKEGKVQVMWTNE